MRFQNWMFVSWEWCSNNLRHTFSMSSLSQASFTTRSQFFWSTLLLGDDCEGAGCGRLFICTDAADEAVFVRLDQRSPTNLCNVISILTVRMRYDDFAVSISCSKSSSNIRSSPRTDTWSGWISTEQFRLFAFFTRTSMTTFRSVWYQSWRTDDMP